MAFVWDEEKRESNLAKHGLDLADAWLVFESPYLERLDQRQNYGEDRWTLLGMLGAHVVFLVYSERRRDIRVISLRKATPQERRIYEQAVQNRPRTP